MESNPIDQSGIWGQWSTIIPDFCPQDETRCLGAKGRKKEEIWM